MAASTGSAQEPHSTPARLVGVIRDERGTPVAKARLSLSGVGGGVQSNDSGRFVFDSVPAGVATLTARALGFTPVTREVTLVADSTARVELVLGERIAVLAEVSVRARRHERNMEEFERRRRGGFGHHFTAEDLAKRATARVPSVLAHLPGVQLSCRGSECAVLMRRSGGVNGMAIATQNLCMPSLYVDGRLDRTGQAFEMYSDQISAIEVYTRATTRPAEFTQVNHRCGAIAVWTKLEQFENTTDVQLQKRCGARASWCYLRNWWPLAVLVALGAVATQH